MKVVLKFYSKDLEGVRMDIIGLSGVHRSGEEFKELNNGHIFGYRGQKERQERTRSRLSGEKKTYRKY